MDRRYHVPPSRNTQPLSSIIWDKFSDRRMALHNSSFRTLFLASPLWLQSPLQPHHYPAPPAPIYVVGIHISDPLEQELPAPDLYSITDGKNRSRINTASQRHRQAYKTGFQQEMARIQEEFLRVRSSLLALQTHQSIVDGLNRQAGLLSAS